MFGNRGVIEVREYIDLWERSPFARWLDSLKVQAAAKVTTELESMADANLSNARAAGGGVLEFRIDFGPGYRVSFGRDGERLVILLGGGAKKRQPEDIRAAQANWESYRRRRKGETTYGADQGRS